MIKIIKSFKSAHDAVTWIKKSRIENTSIEVTGTLKSFGMSRVPSGNYHVVTKNVRGDTDPYYQSPEQERVQGLFHPSNLRSNEVADALKNGSTDPNHIAHLLNPSNYHVDEAEEFDPDYVGDILHGNITKYIPHISETFGIHPKNVRRFLSDIDYVNSEHFEEGEEPPTHAELAGRYKDEKPEGVALQSVSHKDLVNAIAKSVVEVLKSLR